MGFQRKSALCFLSLLIAVASFGVFISKPNRALADPTPLQTIKIGNFETNTDGWTFYPGSEFPGATGALELDAAVYYSGVASGKVTGNFQGGGNYVSINRNVGSSDIKELSFWVKTSDIGMIGLRLTDTTNQTHQQMIPLQPTSDWQQIIVTKFDGGTQYLHWGGANDGVWHGPAKSVSFMLDRTKLLNGMKAGSFWIDSIEMKTPMPLLEIKQVKLGNVFQEQEPAAFQILTQGDTVTWSVYDYWGNRVAGQTDPVDGYTKALSIPGLQRGYYTLKFTAEQNGSPLKQAEQSLAVLAPYDFSKVSDSPFGMATHLGGSTWKPDIIPLLAQAGSKNMRDELYWVTVEPQKGVYSFPPAYDLYMSELQNHSINPFIIFSYVNPYYDNGATPYTEAGRQGFANYGREIVRHYDSIEWVEVYNEFNIPVFGDKGGGPADARADYYFQLLKETYQTVKPDQPDVTLVGAAAGGIPWAWLEQLFQLGGLNYMDALSVHPYRYPGAPESLAQDLVKLQDLIKKYNNGQTKPIWITEIGWPTQLDAKGVSENTQAEYIVRSQVVALGQGVEKIFWYDFKNDGVSKTYNEYNFGVVRNESDEKGKYAPKPAYAAYAAMTRQLTGKPFRQTETVGSGINSYLFGSGSEETRVVWSTAGTKQITVHTDAPITVTDIVGKEETFVPLNGSVYLTVSGSPIYIRGEGVSIAEGSKFSLSGSQAVTGEPLSLVLSADNTVSPLGSIAASLDIGGQSYDFEVMPGEKKDVAISVLGETVPQTKTLFGYIRSGGNLIGKIMVQVPIVDSVQYQVKHVLRANQDTVSVNVYNYQSRAYTLDRIDWQMGTQNGSFAANLVVPAKSTGSVDILVPSLPYGSSYPVTLALHSTDTPPVIYTGSIKLVDPSSMKPALEKTVSVDGVSDDLTGVPAITLTADGVVKMQGYSGTDDLSGQMWVNWDKTNLYISARIHDDTFSQSFTADGIWQGDSVQFAVSPGTPGEAMNWYEFGMALTPAGPQLNRWMSAQGQPSGLVVNRQLSVIRDESKKDTIYELALPWTELAPALPDDGMLSLSLLVNDNDGQGRKGWIEWGSGIGGNKDNKLFKTVRLVKAPITTASVSPAQPDGQNGWYAHPVTLSLTAQDDASSVAEMVYSLDGGGTWQTYSAPLTLSQDGLYTVSYRSTNNGGVTEPTKSVSFKVDATAPTIAVTVPTAASYSDGDDLTPQFTVADGVSGVDGSRTVMTLDGQTVQAGAAVPLYTLPLGSHVLAVTAADLAGNTSSQSVTFETATSIASLQSLVTRFAGSGWINESDIAASLIEMLNEGSLISFMNTVQAQSGKHISEAAAGYLLRDAQWLLDHS